MGTGRIPFPVRVSNSAPGLTLEIWSLGQDRPWLASPDLPRFSFLSHPGDHAPPVNDEEGTEVFRPLPGIKREAHRVIVTNSADTPLKGLTYLLEAVAKISHTRKIHLTVIGRPRNNGQVSKAVRDLGLKDSVLFTGRIGNEDLVKLYASSSVAVVPSVYEGFGFPAGEAMARVDLSLHLLDKCL